MVTVCAALRRFYHGHVEPVMDMYSGQIGPLIIYEQGVLNGHGLPTVSIVRSHSRSYVMRYLCLCTKPPKLALVLLVYTMYVRSKETVV